MYLVSRVREEGILGSARDLLDLCIEQAWSELVLRGGYVMASRLMVVFCLLDM